MDSLQAQSGFVQLRRRRQLYAELAGKAATPWAKRRHLRKLLKIGREIRQRRARYGEQLPVPLGPAT